MGTPITNSTAVSSIQETTAPDQKTTESDYKSLTTNTTPLPQPDDYFSLECSEKAVDISRSHNYLFAKEQIAKLCQGTQSTAPADCAADAADIKRSNSYFLNADQIVSLCKGAESTTPAFCAKKASEIKRSHDYFYTPDDVVTLCKTETRDDDCLPRP